MGTLSTHLSSNELRHRTTKPIAAKETKDKTTPHFEEDIDTIKKNTHHNNHWHEHTHQLASTLVVIMSFFTTFYKIWYPAQVVFDEVHFGKFAGYYLQRTFFFDVHPPLAKLMYAAVGYLVGFDGVYQFTTIGESYADNQVPYIALRALPAALNVLSVALVYRILKSSGASILTCFLVSTLYCLDNAFIGQNRLILLDSMLIFFMLTTIYSYVEFRRHRHLVKMVGLFTVAAIGVAVVIDLWDLLDYKKHGLSNRQFIHHFFARFASLIVIPCVVYMFWFYVHFEILKFSGPGDVYMSAAFQETLHNNPLRLQSLEIMYNQVIRLQHRETSAFLHSHSLPYPGQYEDGRYSSQGIQVTGNPKPDANSYWRIKPTKELDPTSTTHYVRHNDIIQLEHVASQLNLMTHNVAAPLTPTHQEFTVVNHEKHYNDTLFRLELDDAVHSDIWSTMTKSVRLIHVNTGAALWCNSKHLPAWGASHFEVNGNRLASQPKNYWMATEIFGLNATEINLEKNKQVRSMSFLVKFIDLQMRMIVHNNRLVGSHPYQSTPISWPLMTRGISYWTDSATRGQIYLTGNIAGWWVGFTCLGLFALGYLGHQMIEKRRDCLVIHPTVKTRLTRTGGFFFLLWALHYLPFYLMGRSLFLHHYLPAMACNYLLLGSVFEYLFVNGVNSPASYQPNEKKLSVNQARLKIKSFLAASVLLGMQFMVYLFLSPLTYGDSGLPVEEIARRKVLEGWDIQFVK
ncbi:Dolichyl-phosphate-mannose--protein mannosyltransferase 4 [Choanephora cucurbitarum]|uniref:Dolichyl-phosphate-mannose--protein mannosyltransferase n=1 Tax=Choanephora cucurbitarum TaxID=101091 RepID=A0A1C7NJH5_9FUNG|nr:Dolichyl-phosphate-mannose--protein mannosyltransferase 4 [Choanephora cucurbitarum]